MSNQTIRDVLMSYHNFRNWESEQDWEEDFDREANCLNSLNIAAAQIQKIIEEEKKVAYRAGFKAAQDRSFEQYKKVEEFYKDKSLDDILFPDHCSSCHTEWDDNGIEEFPCCAKAKSNIKSAVEKWHRTRNGIDRANLNKVLK